MTKRYRLDYAPASKDDLRKIYAYIAYKLKERQTALNLIKRIRAEISSLKTMPERYAQGDWEAPELKELRKLPVGNFVVLYLVEQETVRIVRILYGGRDIENVLENK